MPKFEGLKLKKKAGGEMFLHAATYRNPFKPVGYIRELPAGWYSQTFESFPVPGKVDEIAEYLTYWGPVRPTPKQYRRHKKMLRRV